MWILKIYPPKNRSGFTLLEIMFALFLIGAALTVLLVSQSQSLSLANEAKFNTTASLLAQWKMAEIELKDINDLVSDSGDFGEDYPGYYWKLDVNQATLPMLENISDRLMRLDLTVYFGEKMVYQYNLRLYRFVPKSG